MSSLSETKVVLRDELLAIANEWLQPSLFADYCPNGLQVEGKAEIKHIVSGVTASLALIDAAIEKNADVLLVHHGYFWRGEDARIVGMKRKRVEKLLQHGINLIAYHLPLDAHPQLGNNAQLAKRLGLRITGGLDPNNPRSIGSTGELLLEQSLTQFSEKIAHELQRKPLIIIGGDHPIKRIGWCTGAAQDYIQQAIDGGMDTYLTGEISEQTVHVARECGIHLIAAGHHATERYGVQALGEALAQHFAISHEFMDCDNPV